MGWNHQPDSFWNVSNWDFEKHEENVHECFGWNHAPVYMSIVFFRHYDSWNIDEHNKKPTGYTPLNFDLVD